MYKYLLKHIEIIQEGVLTYLQFVNSNSNKTTYYPLHSLRVSLITAYALEGGGPMPILSKAIAGHARLVMTFYYTKAVINAQKSGASIVISDKGICPKGCFGCDCGGTYINEDADKTTYGPVPGFPEQNCVRCRWFVTGPAFLPGLVHHWL